MNYRREIDGLRALAVLPVMLFHAGFDTFGGGFVGVDVFFVISGYLITAKIIGDLQRGTFSIVAFYEGRARRILPALYLMMLLSIPFAWMWLLPGELVDFSRSIIAVSIFVSNFFFRRATEYFDTAAEMKPLLHTWSLAVEEQYYILFPMFLLAVWRMARRWLIWFLAVAFFVSLAVAQWGSVTRPAASFFLLPTRAWELLIGGFAPFVLKRWQVSVGRGSGEIGGWTGLILICWSVVTYSSKTPYPGFYAMMPTVGTLLIILFCGKDTSLGRFLANRVLVGIGLISYSAYIWHQPLFAFARHRNTGILAKSDYGLLIVGALVLAYLSWKYLEGPFRDTSRFTRRQVFTLVAVASTFFVTVGFYGQSDNGMQSRFPSEVVSVAGMAKDHVVLRDDGGCNLSQKQFEPRLCVKGDLSATPKYLLLGDSHAASLAFELSRDLRSRGRSFLQLTKNACPPADAVISNRFENCERFNDFVANLIASGSFDAFIVVARWTWYIEDEGFDNGEGGSESAKPFSFTVSEFSFNASLNLRRERILDAYVESVRRLIATGKTVILVYPIPEQGWDVPKQASKMLMFTGERDFSFGVRRSVYEIRNRAVVSAFDSLTEHANLVRILPDKMFCDTPLNARCAAFRDGKSLYYDDDHLSNEGARLLVKEISASLP